MDQYFVMKLLGRGAEGQVLQCQDKKTNEIVAIKRIEWDSLERANQALNEAMRLLSLPQESPFIVHYKRVFLHKYPKAETLFVCCVMEYCAGGDFSHVIKRSWRSKRPSLTEYQILQYLHQICEGLAFLHENGIIHRDLKPSNILCSTESRKFLKIADFGTAFERHGTTLCQTVVGTPNYMSYEMLSENAMYDEKTDLYSLGVVLLEMLTGKSMMLSAEMNKHPQLFDHFKNLICGDYKYSQSLFDLMLSLLSFQPSKRPTAKHCIRIVKKMIMKIEKQQSLQERSLGLESLPSLNKFHFNLDRELKLYVLQFLNISDLYNLMLSSRSYYQLSNTESLWLHLCHKLMGKPLSSPFQSLSLSKTTTITTTSSSLSTTTTNLSSISTPSIHSRRSTSPSSRVSLLTKPLQRNGHEHRQKEKKIQPNISWKQYMYEFLVSSNQTITAESSKNIERKKYLFGKHRIHEIRPNELVEASQVLALAYQHHPIFYYIITGNKLPTSKKAAAYVNTTLLNPTIEGSHSHKQNIDSTSSIGMAISLENEKLSKKDNEDLGINEKSDQKETTINEEIVENGKNEIHQTSEANSSENGNPMISNVLNQQNNNNNNNNNNSNNNNNKNNNNTEDNKQLKNNESKSLESDNNLNDKNMKNSSINGYAANNMRRSHENSENDGEKKDNHSIHVGGADQKINEHTSKNLNENSSELVIEEMNMDHKGKSFEIDTESSQKMNDLTISRKDNLYLYAMVNKQPSVAHPKMSNTQLESLQVIMYELLRHTVKYGRVYVLTEYDSYGNEQIQCVGLGQPPYNCKVIQFYKSLMGKNKYLLMKLGVKIFFRLYYSLKNDELEILKYMNTNSDGTTDINGITPTWVVYALAVRPEYQHKGMGGLVLNPFIKMADENQLNCLVLTRDVRNLSFFKRFGFYVKNIKDLLQAMKEKKETGVCWIMERSYQEVFVHHN